MAAIVEEESCVSGEVTAVDRKISLKGCKRSAPDATGGKCIETILDIFYHQLNAQVCIENDDAGLQAKLMIH